MEKPAGLWVAGHQQPGGFAVAGQGLVPVVGLHHREVQDIVDLLGQRVEVAGDEVDLSAAHTRVLEALAGGRIPEAGRAPHVVVGGQGPGDGLGDLSGHAGDEDGGAR